MSDINAIGRSTAARINRNREQKFVNELNRTTSNPQHRNRLEDANAPVNYDTSSRDHIRTQLSKEAYKVYGPQAKKQLCNLNNYKFLGYGLTALVIAGALGGGYLGFAQAGNLATLVNGVTSRNLLNAANPIIKTGISAAGGLTAWALGNKAGKYARNYLEQSENQAVGTLAGTIDEMQRTAGTPQKMNQDAIVNIAGTKRDTLADAINDFKVISQITSEDKKFETPRDAKKADYEVGRFINNVNDDTQENNLEGIENPTIKRIVRAMPDASPEKLKKAVLDAFPDNIISIAQEPEAVLSNMTLLYGNKVTQYKNYLLAKTKDETLIKIINAAASMPKATPDTIRNTLLGASAEGIIVLIKQALSAEAEDDNVQSVYEAIDEFVQDPKIRKVAQEIRKEGGDSSATYDAVMDALDIAQNSARLQKNPFTKEMTSLPTGKLTQREINELDDAERRLGAGSLNNETKLKLKALENYGVKPDLNKIYPQGVPSPLNVNDFDQKLTEVYNLELDYALPLYWAESSSANAKLLPTLTKFQEILGFEYSKSKNTANVVSAVQKLIDNSDDLVKPVLRAALKRFVQRQEDQSYAEKHDQLRHKDEDYFDKKSKQDELERAQKMHEKREKVKIILDKVSKTGSKFTWREGKRLNEIIDDYNRYSGEERKIFKKIDVLETLKSGGRIRWELKQRRGLGMGKDRPENGATLRGIGHATGPLGLGIYSAVKFGSASSSSAGPIVAAGGGALSIGAGVGAGLGIGVGVLPVYNILRKSWEKDFDASKVKRYQSFQNTRERMLRSENIRVD